MEKWAANSYTSCNVEFSSDEESDEMEEDESGDEDEEDGKTARIIHYVVGDVTHPQNTSTEDAIIVHCVGQSIARLGSQTIQSLFITSIDKHDKA